MVGTNCSKAKKKRAAVPANPLKFLARPERFELPACGFEARKRIARIHPVWP